jgi:hypothetical protein
VRTGYRAVVIPHGAPVQLSVVDVRNAGRVKGHDRIDLKVDSITFNGKIYPVASTIGGSRGRPAGPQGSPGDRHRRGCGRCDRRDCRWAALERLWARCLVAQRWWQLPRISI